MTYGTYHYTVSNNKIIGVHGSALRDLAFQFAAKQRLVGIACEVFIRTGERACVGEPLPREGGSTIATKRGLIKE